MSAEITYLEMNEGASNQLTEQEVAELNVVEVVDPADGTPALPPAEEFGE